MSDIAHTIKLPSEEEMRVRTMQRLQAHDPTCLSWWFPKLVAAGLPVPKTRIERFDDYETARDLEQVLDGEPAGPAGRAFIDRLRAAVQEIGCPCFIRTGQTSGKHSWIRTCYLADAALLDHHLYSLIEFSECADFFGLLWNVWVVRELLPTSPVATLPRYSDMPLCREFRCFVDGATLLCHHPYWPRGSIIEGFRDLPPCIDEIVQQVTELTDQEREQVTRLASRAGAVLGGRWSVDILDTRDGWYVTDMAEMQKSWHWPECPHATRRSNP